MKIRNPVTAASAVAALTVATALITVPALASTGGTHPVAPNAPAYGTVSGTLTTQQGVPLNGMCVILYKGSYAKGSQITTAPTGTGGTNGLFTQANVPVGTYLAFFYNCDANTDGTVDPDYVNIFYGNTYNPAKATKFTVAKNTTTSLGTNPVPLGGTVIGTVTDSTLGGPATDFPAVGILIPGADKLNLGSSQGWYIVCADSNGFYAISGVPTGGVKVVFAPADWGCPYDSSGDFNFGFYNQKESGVVQTTPDVTTTVNGSVTEGSSYPAASPAARRAHASPAPRIPLARS